MRQLFSDREFAPRLRTSETIDGRVWGGLVVLINTRIQDGSFGFAFPLQCRDGQGVTGCDSIALGTALRAEVDVAWPLDIDEVPNDPIIIYDTLEFLYEAVGKPVNGSYHQFFDHYHLTFNVPLGQQEYVTAVNRVLARNGIAFEITQEGRVQRLLPVYIGDQITSTVFRTGDTETDRLLELARTGIISPTLADRKDGLEKLYDAFERLKTLEPAGNKHASAEALLNMVSAGPSFRITLGEEAKALTDAGNKFRIRHSEVSQEILKNADQVDYLFFRMFAFLQLLLRASGRGF